MMIENETAVAVAANAGGTGPILMSILVIPALIISIAAIVRAIKLTKNRKNDTGKESLYFAVAALSCFALAYLMAIILKSMPVVVVFLMLSIASGIYSMLITNKESNRLRSIAKMNQQPPKENRRRCKVCGEIFCFNDHDLQSNQVYKKMERMERVSAAVDYSVGAGRIAGALSEAAADRYSGKIRDYTRCPYCNSSDLDDISETEFEAITSQIDKKDKAISEADELVKFKELLDRGIITQEEFDAKKKQLLGL